MRKGLLLALISVTLTGCPSSPESPAPPPPPPTIRVERQEDVNGIKFVIWYDNHKREYYGNHRYSEPYAEFHVKDKEALEEYKRQLEFALSQIEEVEQRIEVHEPESQADATSVP